MESTSIEYLTERECDVTQIGGQLDEKGYGIAMRKNSPYRSSLSEAVLRLQEQGKLTAMKTKWWKEKRGGGACSVSHLVFNSQNKFNKINIPNFELS